MTASSQAGPSNPFSKRGNGTQSSTSLKKTGSFFDRVDASNGLTPSGAALQKTSSAGKQSTLFGLPPASKEAADKKSSNRGRKRKSDANNANADGEDESVLVTSIRKQPKKLESFFGGKAGSSGKKNGDASNKKARSASTSDREGSANVTDSQAASQDNDDDGEGTQEQEEDVPTMDDNTSSESMEAEPVTPAADEEPVKSPAKESSSLSKLAAFKFTAAAAASTTETEEEEA